MSFKFSGGVEVLGFISPTEPTDQYPVIDPLYGIDGFRNVDTLLDLNAIPNLRRRAGMVVGINGGAQYYKLNPSPWNGTITDWSIFNTGGGGNPYVTGFTYDNSNTFTILTSSPSIFNATINEVTGLTINGNLLVTGNTNLFGLSTYQGPVTGLNTKELINYEYLTSYVSANDIYSTGGTVSQYPSPSSNVVSVQIDGNSGFTPFNITGLTDTFINDFSYSANTFTISQNDGSNFDAIIDTINLESVLSAATFDIGTTGTISANIFSGGTYYGDGSNLSGITTANVFVYSGNANVSTSELTFLNTTGGTFTVTNSAALFADNDINVTGGTYNPTTGCVTFTTNSGTTFDVCGFLTGFTDTYVTGATFSANQVILSRNDGFDVLKISGGTNVTLTNPSTNEIVIGVTIPPDTNTFVTGFTYNDNNTFTLTRNDGVDISTSINIVTGLTVNGDIEMGNSSTRQIYSTGVSEISSIEFTTSGTSVQMRWDGSGNSTVFTVNNTDFATLSSNKTAFGGLTYGSDYSPYYTDRSLIDLGYFNSNNRYVTGGTYNSGTTSIDYVGVNGFTPFSVNLSSLAGGLNTYVTGFTYDDSNTLTISQNDGSNYTANISIMTGLTISGNLYTQYIFDKNNVYGTPGQILVSTSTGVEWATVNSTCQSTSATTNNLEYKFIDNITGFTNGSYIVKSYITSYSGTSKYGFWERTLGVVTTGDTPVISIITQDFDDYSLGFLPTQIDYIPKTGNTIDIYISGLTSEDLYWESHYDIIGQNCTSNVDVLSSCNLGSFGINLSNGSSDITTGQKGYVKIPYPGTISDWTIMTDTSGSIVIDIWKDSLANFPPTSLDSITNGNYAYLSNQIVNSDNVLSGWTTTFLANDVFTFDVIGVTGVTNINLTLNVIKN